MGEFRLILSRESEKQLIKVKKSGDKVLMEKIKRLFRELELHPSYGTGKPEQLKHGLSGLWSRELNKKSRIVYEIDDENSVVNIVSLIGHYNDK